MRHSVLSSWVLVLLVVKFDVVLSRCRGLACNLPPLGLSDDMECYTVAAYANTEYCKRITGAAVVQSSDGSYTVPGGVVVDASYVQQMGVPTSVAGVYDWSNQQTAQWKVNPSIAGKTSFKDQYGPCEDYQVVEKTPALLACLYPLTALPHGLAERTA